MTCAEATSRDWIRRLRTFEAPSGRCNSNTILRLQSSRSRFTHACPVKSGRRGATGRLFFSGPLVTPCRRGCCSPTSYSRRTPSTLYPTASPNRLRTTTAISSPKPGCSELANLLTSTIGGFPPFSDETSPVASSVAGDSGCK